MTEASWIDQTVQKVGAPSGSTGSRQAIVFFDGDRERTCSFAELDRTVARLANGLAARGLMPGQVAGVVGRNSPEWVIACLAILRCGGVVAPLDAQLGQDAFSHILQDCEAKFLFVSAAAAGRYGRQCADAGVETIGLEPSDQCPELWSDLLMDADSDPPDAAPSDQAALFYTSGTTGPPKGVPLTHRNLAHQIACLAGADLVSADERVMVPLPLHHVYPFVVGTLTPLALQRTLILTGGFTGTRVLDALRRGKATMLIGVPRLYEALVGGLDQRIAGSGVVGRGLMGALRGTSAALFRWFGWRAGRALLRPLHGRLAPELRTLVSGGSALKPALGRTLESLGWRVATGYGLTETSPMISFDMPDRVRFDSAGRPIPETEIRIDAKSAEIGEVLVRGPSVFAGYHHLPDKTAEVFTPDGWFRTGDLGWLDGDGRLHLTGRSSTVIVTEAGKNLQPEEIEEAYQAHSLIAEIAVYQRDGKLAGLIVANQHGTGAAADDAAIRAAVSEVSRGLPSYKRLSEYALTAEAIPRTRLGKPRRHLIAERYELALSGVQTQTPAEAKPIDPQQMSDEDRALLDEPGVGDIWQLLANRFAERRLTPDSDLRLDLGIDSIDWLNLSLEVSERAGVTLSEQTIAEVSTVRDLLTAVAEGEPASGQTGPLDDPETALSDQQKSWLRPLGPVATAFGWLCHRANRLLVRALFLRRVSGLENLPTDRPVVLAPNHLSYLDPFIVAAALSHTRLRRTYWAGWTGVVFTSAIRRGFARIARVLPVDPDKAASSSLAFGAAALQRNNDLIWFPEGARSRDGEIQPFKAGIGMLLDRYQVDVVPVVITGTFTAWPPGRTLPRSAPASIRFLAPCKIEDLLSCGEGATNAAKITDGLQQQIIAGIASERARPPD